MCVWQEESVFCSDNYGMTGWKEIESILEIVQKTVIHPITNGLTDLERLLRPVYEKEGDNTNSNNTNEISIM